jgi:hypothetical protein
MNVIVDLDEVCYKFVEGYLKYYNVKHGTNIEKKQITKWNWWEIDGIGMTKEKFYATFDEFNRNKMWQGLEVYEDATCALCAIAEDGHNIYYMTDRPRDARRATLKTLIHNGLPVDSVIFARGHDKANIAKVIKADIAIDDKASTIQNYIDLDITAVIRNQPQNRDHVFSVNDSLKLLRCDSLTEFYHIIKSCNNKT